MELVRWFATEVGLPKLPHKPYKAAMRLPLPKLRWIAALALAACLGCVNGRFDRGVAFESFMDIVWPVEKGRRNYSDPGDYNPNAP